MPSLRHFAAVLCLALCGLSTAHAASPSDAQIERLLEVMGSKSNYDQIVEQILESTEHSAMQSLGDNVTDEERVKFKAFMQREGAIVRKRMGWETMVPLIKRIYARTFSAEEAEAMIAFYGSPVGRSIQAKLPLIVQTTMTEMQPLMREVADDLKKDAQRALDDMKKDANLQ